MTDQVQAPAPPAKTILISVAGALAAAIVVLVAFVLPAEIGLDPLGTGRLFGLTGLANPPSPALTPAAQGIRSEEIEFALEPFQSVEYKYELAEGAGMTFSWSADGDVYYDMHAEPEGAEPGYAESFAIGTGSRQDGVYVPTFPGIHGWFWENRGTAPVMVRLESAGFYTGAIIFEGGGQTAREIPG